jgi:hypothetical protein
MRIKQLQLVVAPEDLIPLLTGYIPQDRVTGLSAATREGVLQIRCEYRLGPIPIPVDLSVRIAEVRPDALALTVTASSGMVQEALLTMLRSSHWDFLRVQGSHLLLGVDALAPYIHARFRLSRAAFTAEGIALAVTDLQPLKLPPPLLAGRTAQAR